MTWLATFFLRAFVVLLQVSLIYSDENGAMPGFKQQPADTIVRSRNQTILCDVKGEKPLKITWIKNEQILNLKNFNYLSISPEGALNIFNTERKRDEGRYRCKVQNKYGTVISKSAKLTFPYMKEFTALDSRVTVNDGEKAFLGCHAPESYPDRNIYWSKSINRVSFPLQLEKKSHLSISESGDLHFSYTDDTDFGVYHCSVENNNLRRVLKRTVVLRINKNRQKNISPEVWKFEDKIAIKGSDALLECISYGRPIPVMKFRHVKTGTYLIGAKQVANRLRYEFGRFDAQHEGEYSCEVSNIFGHSSSKSAYIKMEEKPSLITESRTISVAVDSMKVLPCVAIGVPRVRYTWFFNGLLLNTYNGIETHGGNITIQKVMKDHHQGFYQCIAQNKHGEDIMTIYLKVVGKAPTFEHPSIKPSKNTHAIIGGTTEIHCVPQGAPKPSIYWRKKSGSDITKDSRFLSLSSGTLKITNIKKSDQGAYECIARNRMGTARAEGNLLVTDELAIIDELTRSDQVVVGQKMRLKCTISSSENMEVVFTWYFGSSFSKRQLRNNKRRKITKLNTKQSLLEIEKVNTRDTGIYTCEVRGTKNRSDERRQYIIVTGPNGHEVPEISSGPPGIKTTAVANTETTKLVLIGPPDPPQEVTATELNGVNIKISWTMGLDNGKRATEIYIQARTTFDLDTWETIKISNKTIRDRESEIVQLSPWVEYKIRVIAENGNGKSKPSHETEKWIRTPTAKPIKYPTNIRGNGTGPNELIVSFDPLDEIDQNAPGIQYYVHYRKKFATHPMAYVIVPRGKNFLKLTFKNTDSFYKPYEFQVQARNDEGFGPKSPIYTAYTGERTPVSFPTNLKVRIAHPTTAKATWAEVSKSRELIRGKFIGYKFLYWVKPKPNHPTLEQYVASYTSTVTIKLLPYTEYYFQVLAFNGAGDGPGSVIVGPIKTPEARPGPPMNFKISDATEGEVTLAWKEPEHKNGELLQYILYYRSLPDGEDQQAEIRVDETFHVLTNLDPNTKYAFKLAATTVAGVGEYAQVTFDLSKVPAVTPEKPSVGSIGHDAIVLTWTPVTLKDLTGYKVFYWRSGEKKSKAVALWEQSDDIVTTVENLDPNTVYFFRIAVFNKYGTSRRSEIVSARTKVDKNANPKDTTNDKSSSSRSSKLSISNYIIPIVLLVAVLLPG